ncbi:hypothetical protein [Pediococcus argentinicus]|uniref:Uncharacterized protein n=1 Tax=Pediococcus argentinicus TaxID=480391 RepID=A0A0R2N8U4_9LACO|nr:hypothetical protein [Pediococcus argentinicus]KRO22247.1 hypothetical protein IV88_GL001176 [Pediococcus argentinicus]NKZ23062.1 hypothetical protein [Pediococcus argentinicus]GEP20177.1 hypothetical protein LSA03_15610 [Pediococcus argentinicus]
MKVLKWVLGILVGLAVVVGVFFVGMNAQGIYDKFTGHEKVEHTEHTSASKGYSRTKGRDSKSSSSSSKSSSSEAATGNPPYKENSVTSLDQAKTLLAKKLKVGIGDIHAIDLDKEPLTLDSGGKFFTFFKGPAEPFFVKTDGEVLDGTSNDAKVYMDAYKSSGSKEASDQESSSEPSNDDQGTVRKIKDELVSEMKCDSDEVDSIPDSAITAAHDKVGDDIMALYGTLYDQYPDIGGFQSDN